MRNLDSKLDLSETYHIWYNSSMSLHHIHQRKRASGKALHSFPAEKLSLRFLDRLVYIAGMTAIIMMIPQLIVIYGEKNASGFTPVTWGTLALLNIPWIIYGLVHKEGPIAMTYFLWFIVNGLIFIGAILY